MEDIKLPKNPFLNTDGSPLTKEQFRARFGRAEEEIEDRKKLVAQNPGSITYERNNYTALPSVIFDYFIPVAFTDLDELKVFLYICRHIFGYKGKGSGDWITQQQILDGTLKKGSGVRIDFGAGIELTGSGEIADKKKISRICERLEAKGLIEIVKGERRSPRDKHPTTFYRVPIQSARTVEEALAAMGKD